MNIERFVGLAFSIGLLLLTLFVFLKPQIDYQQEQKIEDLINRKISFYLANKFLGDRESIVLFKDKTVV